MKFKGVSRFGRVSSKELFTLAYDPNDSSALAVTLYNQNLVPPPEAGQTFITVSSTDALPSTDVVYSGTGVASSGVVTPTTTTTTTTTTTSSTTTSSGSSTSSGGSSTPSGGGGY